MPKSGSNSLHDVVWNALSSLKLTIFLLILLAATSVLGTIILQNGTPQQYLSEYGPRLARILDFLDLFDMYHSWWFRAVLALLVVNLIFCSLNRLPSAWRRIFRVRVDLNPSGIEAKPYTRALEVPRPGEHVEEEIEASLRWTFGKPKRLEDSRRVLLFFVKGRYGRLGVYVAHLGVIVIVVGGMIGSVFGFKGFVKITEGETAERVLLRKKGGFVAYPLGYQVRCDDFEISYYDTPGPERFVSEYTSTLSILENGRTVRHVKVRVNHPLTYRGLRFYQSSYGQEADVGLRVRQRGGKASYDFQVREGERIRVPKADVAFELLRYFPDVHGMGEGVQLAVFFKNKAPQRIWLFRKMPDFDGRRRGDFIFSITNVHLKDFTVLQVTRDPGVWVVWIGSALLVVGLTMAFFVSHRWLWVHISREGNRPARILMGGNTNRDRVGFEKVFADAVQHLERIGLKPL